MRAREKWLLAFGFFFFSSAFSQRNAPPFYLQSQNHPSEGINVVCVQEQTLEGTFNKVAFFFRFDWQKRNPNLCFDCYAPGQFVQTYIQVTSLAPMEKPNTFRILSFRDEKYYQTLRLDPYQTLVIQDPSLVQRLYHRGETLENITLPGLESNDPALEIRHDLAQFRMNVWKSRKNIDPDVYDGNVRIEYRATLEPYSKSKRDWDQAWNANPFDKTDYQHERTLLGFNKLKNVSFTQYYDDPKYASHSGSIGDMDCFQYRVGDPDNSWFLPPEEIEIPQKLFPPSPSAIPEEPIALIQEKPSSDVSDQPSRPAPASPPTSPKKDSTLTRPSEPVVQAQVKTVPQDSMLFTIPKDPKNYPVFDSNRRETIQCNNSSNIRSDYFVYLNINRVFTISKNPEYCSECFGARDGVGNRYKLQTELKLRKRDSSSTAYDYVGSYENTIHSYLDVSKVYQGRSFILPFSSPTKADFQGINWMIFNPNPKNDILINLPILSSTRTINAKTHYLAISGEIQKYMTTDTNDEPKLPSNIRANIHLLPFLGDKTHLQIDLIKGADLFCKKSVY